MKNTICHKPETEKEKHFKTGKKVQRGKIYRKIIGNLWCIFNKTQRKISAVYLLIKLATICTCNCQSQWPCGLTHRSSTARLLRLWVHIPPGAWMFVCCECCALSGTGLLDRLITRPEESNRLWRVVACDQETSKTRRLKPTTGLWKIQPQWVVMPGKQTNMYMQLVNIKTDKVHRIIICGTMTLLDKRTKWMRLFVTRKLCHSA